MKWFRKRQKLHDGYTLSLTDNNKVYFYDISPLEKVMAEKVRKVDVEKVRIFEGVCLALSKNFMKAGLLRLHTPLDRYWEFLGTYFLYVPLTERSRVVELLKGGMLISRNPFAPPGETYELIDSNYSQDRAIVYVLLGGNVSQWTFYILPPGKQLGPDVPLEFSKDGLTIIANDLTTITMGDLIGTGEIINPAKSSQDEAQIFIRNLWQGYLTMWTMFTCDKFFVISLPHKGMFVEREKT